MGTEDSWGLETSASVGQVTIEILAGADRRVLSIDTPGWSFAFLLPNGGVAHVAEFLRLNAGRAEFAKCLAGSFHGYAVWLINDSEYADRLWLRISENGQLADFPLVGEIAQCFGAAVAEVADSADK